MKTIHGFKYHDLIHAALRFFGPLTAIQLQSKLTMRLDGFKPPLDIIRMDAETLVKRGQIKHGKPKSVYVYVRE